MWLGTDAFAQAPSYLKQRGSGVKKQTVEIEKLLQWTYVDELPKRQNDPTWAGMFSSSAWQLGARVDVSSTGDCYPVALGAPHTDALMLDHAVRSLPSIEPDAKLMQSVLGQYAPYLKPTVTVMSNARSVLIGGNRAAPSRDPVAPGREMSAAESVIRHARLCVRPSWDVGEVKLVRVMGANNKPAINGLTAGGRYAPGAHGMVTLDPPAHVIASARLEYALWHAALRLLASEFGSEGCKLTSRRALAPAAPEAPWEAVSRPTPQAQRINLPTQSGSQRRSTDIN